MKKIINIILVGILSLSLVACDSISEFFENLSDSSITTITTAVTVAVDYGVGKALDSCETDEAKTNITQIFTGVNNAITLAIDGENFEPTVLSEYLNTALADSPYLSFVETALNATIATYNTFYSVNWKDTVESKENMVLFLQAIQAGITLAITDTAGVFVVDYDGKPLEDFTVDDLKLSE